jgi:phenylalanyl-tRNA synthetase beta chain
MKVLLSWLQDFAPIEGDPVALGEQLSDLGMAVEQLDLLGEGLEGIVVAKVLATRPHPQADRMHLVDVDAGDGEALQIACGAFNMAPGDLVPLATIGTVMPDGTKIGRAKKRGEWSNGMLCSAVELGLGSDGAGIYIVPPGLEVGADFSEAMGIEGDALYDLEINPNRPDAMSVAGVARDLAARLGVPFSLPEPRVTEVAAGHLRDVTVEVEAPDLCGRFTARVLTGVTVGPSDPVMALRLSLLGMRPINSLVDVSNYVMLELGQPNHPYDLAKVRGGGLRVRRARAGETLVTLDGVERTLIHDDLLICDAEDRAIGVAGIMGGADTEIDDGTTDVLLEMAWFLPSPSPSRPAASSCAPRRLPASRRAPTPRSSSGPTGASPSWSRARARGWRRGSSTCGASCPTGTRSPSAPAGSTASSAPTWAPARCARCWSRSASPPARRAMATWR